MLEPGATAFQRCKPLRPVDRSDPPMAFNGATAFQRWKRVVMVHTLFTPSSSYDLHPSDTSKPAYAHILPTRLHYRDISRMSAKRQATSESVSGSRCAYLASVNETLACPNLLDTTYIGTPPRSRRDAWVCRRS